MAYNKDNSGNNNYSDANDHNRGDDNYNNNDYDDDNDDNFEHKNMDRNDNIEENKTTMVRLNHYQHHHNLQHHRHTS